MSKKLILTSADEKIRECIDNRQSFSMVAGAGAGKTTSLVMALEYLRRSEANALRQNGQKILCITYTNRAVDVISGRIGKDDLYVVTTLHGFLWSEIRWFTHDIREALRESVIPDHISKAREQDSGKNTKTAIRARERIKQLEEQLAALDAVSSFKYDESSFSDYSKGQLNHEDVISAAGYLLDERQVFRRILGQKYPFIFIDEAQDTFHEIVRGMNLVCAGEGLPVVGYFGDPMQQIYDKRAGDFSGPPESVRITKKENYRCSTSVIDLLNAFRQDVQQIPAGDNVGVAGNVKMTLIEAGAPEEQIGRRKVYSEAQLRRNSEFFEKALADWGWNDGREMKQLFLVRQMIARRLGFLGIHRLFTGPFASLRTKDEYEEGAHFLLKPIVETIWPLVKAGRNGDDRSIIDILRSKSPAFDISGINKDRSLRDMLDFSKELTAGLLGLWKNSTLREILTCCHESSIARFSGRMAEHLSRQPRSEEYDDEKHAEDKADWLCDEFFTMGAGELEAYCEFVEENTVYSTQHGVKGEEYPNVLVVFDDVEAGWTNYSFSKLFTPQLSGDPTEGQHERSRKLAYVCFSRAEENLRIILFTKSPEKAKNELIERGLLNNEQLNIIR